MYLTPFSKGSAKEEYDLIIIGGGPGGLTAGIYATRAGLDTVMLERLMPGGQVVTTDIVENYPGFPQGISGPELMQLIEEQARRFGLEVLLGEAKSIELASSQKILRTTEDSYPAKAVIVATGAEARKLNVPGEDKFTGRGVSYCATCDGAFFRDKEVLVVGGGDTAIEEALFLTRFASKVTVIHRRDELRAVKILQDRAFADKKVDFLWSTVVDEISGDGQVEGAIVRSVKTGERSSVKAEGVFIYVGSKPNSDFIADSVERDENGYIITDENMQTSTPGIYAVGDVRHKSLRQIVTAVGEGATAAMAALKYIENL
jgi:thioredoxin reductase (NADPH)